MMINLIEMKNCRLCPRRCGADRENGTGYCMSGDKLTVARSMLHFFEEPPISGKNGSGAIFFSGCSLRCVYCQNSKITSGASGTITSGEELRRICFSLKSKGAHNINLVTPTHFAPMIREALLSIKEALGLPIVCNTGGYESPETLAFYDGLVDIYLPDFKYSIPDTAKRLSDAEDYPTVALAALKEMVRQVGKAKYFENGMMKSGVIVRHLVLPGERKNSIGVIKILADNFARDDILLSIMSQYTPQNDAVYPLSRRITTFEYESVREYAEKCGFDGFSQEFSSASSVYTPDFENNNNDNQ